MLTGHGLGGHEFLAVLAGDVHAVVVHAHIVHTGAGAHTCGADRLHRVDHGRLASALARTTTLSDLGLTPGGTVRGADLAGDLYQVRLKAGSP